MLLIVGINKELLYNFIYVFRHITINFLIIKIRTHMLSRFLRTALKISKSPVAQRVTFNNPLLMFQGSTARNFLTFEIPRASIRITTYPTPSLNLEFSDLGSFLAKKDLYKTYNIDALNSCDANHASDIKLVLFSLNEAGSLNQTNFNLVIKNATRIKNLAWIFSPGNKEFASHEVFDVLVKRIQVAKQLGNILHCASKMSADRVGLLKELLNYTDATLIAFEKDMLEYSLKNKLDDFIFAAKLAEHHLVNSGPGQVADTSAPKQRRG